MKVTSLTAILMSLLFASPVQATIWWEAFQALSGGVSGKLYSEYGMRAHYTDDDYNRITAYVWSYSKNLSSSACNAIVSEDSIGGTGWVEWGSAIDVVAWNSGMGTGNWGPYAEYVGEAPAVGLCYCTKFETDPSPNSKYWHTSGTPSTYNIPDDLDAFTCGVFKGSPF